MSQDITNIFRLFLILRFKLSEILKYVISILFFATQCLLFQDWEIGGKDASSDLVTWRGWNRQFAVTSRRGMTSTKEPSGVELSMKNHSFK